MRQLAAQTCAKDLMSPMSLLHALLRLQCVYETMALLQSAASSFEVRVRALPLCSVCDLSLCLSDASNRSNTSMPERLWVNKCENHYKPPAFAYVSKSLRSGFILQEYVTKNTLQVCHRVRAANRAASKTCNSMVCTTCGSQPCGQDVMNYTVQLKVTR